jgi:hypothetical protein
MPSDNCNLTEEQANRRWGFGWLGLSVAELAAARSASAPAS